MICVNSVNKSFQGNCVLNHIDFKIPDQTATALIGPNGIGKNDTSEYPVRFSGTGYRRGDLRDS